MRILRAFLACGLSLLVATLAYIALNFVQVLYVGNSDGTQSADAIVVMGAAQYDGTPSPQLAARLDHALRLFEEGRAPLIAVTGGNKPGDRFTEADVSRAYLAQRGVPDSAIVGEDEGRSTWESAKLLFDVLLPRRVHAVIVVSDAYHIQRAVLIFREFGFDAVGSAATTSPVHGSLARSRAFREALGVSLARFIGFERLWKITG